MCTLYTADPPCVKSKSLLPRAVFYFGCIIHLIFIYSFTLFVGTHIHVLIYAGIQASCTSFTIHNMQQQVKSQSKMFTSNIIKGEKKCNLKWHQKCLWRKLHKVLDNSPPFTLNTQWSLWRFTCKIRNRRLQENCGRFSRCLEKPCLIISL